MHRIARIPLLALLLALAAAASVLGASHAAAQAGQGTAAERLKRLFDEDWEVTLREEPFTATSMGDRRFNDRLPQVGLADQERRLRHHRAMLERLRAISRDSLGGEDRINYDIFARQKQDEVEEAGFRAYLIPITNREGFHTFFPELADRVPLQTAEDYRNYIARLRAFRAYAGQHVELMREGIRAGMVLPRISVEGIEATLLPHVVDDPTKSLLWKPFASFPAGVPVGEREALAREGRAAITEGVVAGYRDFHQFMTREYVPAARATIGASALPSGPAYYAQRVRHYTTLPLTAEQVHQTGLSEVRRIRAEMDTVIRRTGFTGDFKGFVRMLRTEPRFYARTPDELMQRTALVL